ncbi:MAG: PIN domain-containing protein [Ilumatobacteraceae bacterium]
MLDTSVVVDAAAGRVELAELPDSWWITTITLGELSAGPLVARSPGDRARRQAVLQEIEAQCAGSVLAYDEVAARAYGRVIADVRRAGRQPRRRTADLMIAAIAIARGLPLYTTDAADVRGISGLQVVAVKAQ